MSILIKTVRIHGFRGLRNIEVNLEQTTLLTGMNNSGKTSFLKAMQLALGNRQFSAQDDFFIQGSTTLEKIIVDLLIVPVDDEGQCENFTDDWEDLFTEDRIKLDEESGQAYVPIRTKITFDELSNSFKPKRFILKFWPDLNKDGIDWFDIENESNVLFRFDEIPFFYMDAQRDILEDTKLKSSFLGKMMSKIQYSKEDIEDLEKQIEALNDKAVSGSDILSNIKLTLKELDSAMDTKNKGIEITPFTKKIRDLNKGLNIYYTDHTEPFPMENHGMGTRSWSSLLTLKAFITLLSKNAVEGDAKFFPIIAIEEPESHLHPNAQKKLYSQIDTIPGQKIISTHSPYIAAVAELDQIRSFYKQDDVACGRLSTESLSAEDIRKIKRQVTNTRGEIFFSKLIVFFEGDSEEQALPIFFLEYFRRSCVEIGIDFIGVGGHKSYLPFLRFAESLNIPWIIFSDGENIPGKDIQASVREQFNNCGSKNSESDCIVFLDDGNDFERQLISDGYGDEIKEVILSLKTYQNSKHRRAMQEKDEKEIAGYDDQKLYKVITKKKTFYSPLIAEQIIKNGKGLPPKINLLFDKISEYIKFDEVQE